MSVPRHVPRNALHAVRSYESPDVVPGPWTAGRVTDVAHAADHHAGRPGPDQGYALRLFRLFAERICLSEEESPHDVRVGCTAIALRRAARFGRAPVAADIEIALRYFGFLDAAPPAVLVDRRQRLFVGVADPHHYTDMRRLAEAVPDDVLAASPAQVARRYAADSPRLREMHLDSETGRTTPVGPAAGQAAPVGPAAGPVSSIDAQRG